MASETKTVKKVVQRTTDDLELVLSDATGMAETAIEDALGSCAQKVGVDRETAVSRLREGDLSACSYFHYTLAGHAAEWLGAWDENVKAVYIYDYDATAEDVCFGKPGQQRMLHLLVWAHRKTQALAAISNALDRALVDGYVESVGARGVKHVLDVQAVDDDEVQNNIGCGALLHSLHTRPIRIWER
ncbi:MAG: hypothetical protein JXD18_02805 [Anaerolineae bacterium]|nr:hypothetical protein [Anaerolineae bacterium]